MTRVNYAAAQNAAKRVSLLIIAGLLSLNLTGCGGSTNSADVSQPLSGAAQQPTAPVAFASIVGAPAATSAKLNEMLTAASKSKNIPVVAASDAEYKMTGFLLVAPEAKGTRLVHTWEVADKTGKRVVRFRGDDLVSPRKTGDAWSLVDEAALQRVAAKTSGDLHDWLTKKDQPAPSAAQPNIAAARPASPAATSSTSAMTPAPAAQPRPPVVRTAARADTVVVVQPVSSAPGDGATSLTAAMRKSLASNGVKVSEGRAANAYTLRGVVEMGQPQNGQQSIFISWQIVDPAGKNVGGPVTQKNNVPEKSLDGAWGSIADLAAGAAAAKIAEIIPKSTS